MTTPLTRDDPVVFHFRKHVKKKDEDLVPGGKLFSDELQATGGATIVFLPELMRFGIAMCCPTDNYCRRLGREIATARAKGWQKLKRGWHGQPLRRFHPSPNYRGPLDMESVKLQTLSLLANAAVAVENVLVEEVATGYVKGTGTS